MFKAAKNTIWTPHPGSQQQFLRCPADEALLHGNRGGGKTDCLLMDYLQHVGVGYGAEYRGIIFREEYTQLTDVINKSKKWISQIFPGAKYNNSDHKWTFPEGEELYLRYMRLPSDYYSYHGHEYSIYFKHLVLMGDGKNKEAGNVKVGDLVQTLQGPKKISKVLRYSKPAIQVSFSGEDFYSEGVQLQGIVHPLLTTYGWRRLGLSCLYQIDEQSQVGKSLIAEVSQFLFGVYQEILGACMEKSSDPLNPSISRVLSVQYFCLYQIYEQFLHLLIRSPLGLKFLPYVALGIPFSIFVGEIVLGNDDKEFLYAHQNVLQLLLYCESLIISLQSIHLNHVHLLQSIAVRCLRGLPLSAFHSAQHAQQHLYGKEFYPLLTYVQYLLVQDQTVWNGTNACVRRLMSTIPNYQYRYSTYRNPYDVQLPHVLKIGLTFSPSKNGVLARSQNTLPEGVQGTAPVCALDRGNQFSYNNPYSHESFEIAHFGSLSSVECSPFGSPVDMVDFEVEDTHHYLTLITDNSIDSASSQYKTTNSSINKTYVIVNQNCFVGWEELSNWATDECYLTMMSTNRSSNPDVPRKYRATTNPAGPGHSWIKARFIDMVPPLKVYIDPKSGKSRAHVVSRLDENTTLLNADPNYQNTIMEAVKDDPVRYKAWVLGSWDIITGGFFSDLWDPKIHVLPYFQIPSTWNFIRSFDWGSAKPWSVTYAAECNGEQPVGYDNLPYFPKGSVVIFNEIYGWNGIVDTGDMATSDVIAERVLMMDKAIEMEFKCRVHPGPADNSIYNVTDGTSIGKAMQSFGLHWRRSYKGPGSRVAGWSLMRSMLGAAKRKSLEAPHLYFTEKARHHIRTLPLMQHDRVKPEDIDSSGEDHCCDSASYLLTRKLYSMRQAHVRH